MAFSSSLLSVLVISFLASSSTICARNLGTKPTLAKRLKLNEDGPSSCWDSLLELQSCSGEVVMFFLNGETYLGPSCCNAIRIIQHHCWPSMLGSLGISTEESDILFGYCDASGGSSTPNIPLPPPNPKNCTASHF